MPTPTDTVRARLAEQADAMLTDLRTVARGMTLPYNVTTADRLAAERTLAGPLRGTSQAVLRVALSTARAGEKVRGISTMSGVQLADALARTVVDAEVDRNVQLRHLDMIAGPGMSAGLTMDARDIDLGVVGVADALVAAGLTYKLVDAISTLSKAASIARDVERARDAQG